MMPLDHLSQPAPKFEPRGNHSYDAVLSPTVDSAFRGLQWTKDPTQNAREFNAAMSGSRFRTLAEMIDTVVPNCGVTKVTGKRVNVTEMSSMVWQNDKEREGFTHHVRLRSLSLGVCKGLLLTPVSTFLLPIRVRARRGSTRRASTRRPTAA